MRVIQTLGIVSLTSNLKLLWDRITFSRITTVYFVFSVLHCVVQVTLQSKALGINNQAASFLRSIVVQGNATQHGFYVLGGDDDFRVCDHIPTPFNISTCEVMWDGTPISDNSVSAANNQTISAVSSYAPSSSSEPSFSSPPTTVAASTTSRSSTLTSHISLPSPSVTVEAAVGQNSLEKPVTIVVVVASTNLPTTTNLPPTPTKFAGDADSDDFEYYYNNNLFERDASNQAENSAEVTLDGLGWHHKTALLNQGCLRTLNFPVVVLENTKREDIVFIAFQYWVLGMSIVALLNESIPHILASLLTHMLATGWAGFQINQTADFHTQFIRLTTRSACEQKNLLRNYWKNRGSAEFSSLALNAAALVVSTFLTWRLVKLFGWQTFKRIGASLAINRVYKTVLTLSITIQLSLFFMFVTVCLWLDQLFNTAIGQLASLAVLYKIISIITLVLLIPWLMLGWFAVRRELRIPMMIFLVQCVAYLAGWAFMFLSPSFRWTFVQWRFFAFMASTSVLLTLIAFVLGVGCRINFGKGLSRYLQAQEPLESDDTTFNDPEKVNFPSMDVPFPTFSSTFGARSGVPPPQQFSLDFDPRFNSNGNLAEVQADVPIQNPSPAHLKSLSNQDSQLERHPSMGSERSFDTGESIHHERNNSQSSQESHGTYGLKSKRWIIE